MTENKGPDGQRSPQQDAKNHAGESKQGKSAGGVGLLAQVSTLSWNLVLPIVGGVLLGYYLDQRSGNGLTWTLSLLVLGVMIAFSNLYNLYIEQGRDHISDENMKQTKQDNHEEEK